MAEKPTYKEEEEEGSEVFYEALTNSVKIISKWNFDLCLKGFQKGIKKVKN